MSLNTSSRQNIMNVTKLKTILFKSMTPSVQCMSSECSVYVLSVCSVYSVCLVYSVCPAYSVCQVNVQCPLSSECRM